MKFSRKWAVLLIASAMITGCSNNNKDSQDQQQTSEKQDGIQLTINPASTSVAVDEQATLTYAISPTGTEISNIKISASGGKATLQGKKVLFTADKVGEYTISLSGESKEGPLSSNEAKISVKTKEDMEKEGNTTSDDNKDEDTSKSDDSSSTTASAGTTSSAGTSGSSSSSTGTSGTSGSTSTSGNSGASAGSSSGSSTGSSSSAGTSSSGTSAGTSGTTSGSSGTTSGSNSSAGTSGTTGSEGTGSESSGSSGNSGNSSSNSGSSSAGSSTEQAPAWIYEEPITIDDLQEYSDAIIDEGKDVTIIGYVPTKAISAANGEKEYCIWNKDWTSYIMVDNPSVITESGKFAYITGKVVDDGVWAYFVIDSYEFMN